jgi:hypothetical protein
MLYLVVGYAALVSDNLEANTHRVMLNENIEMRAWFTERRCINCIFYALLNSIVISPTEIETVLRNWSWHI